MSQNENFFASFSASKTKSNLPLVPSIAPKFSVPIQPCVERDHVNLEFDVKGQPEPKVIFYKNNRQLQPNESVDISKHHHLHIGTNP